MPSIKPGNATPTSNQYPVVSVSWHGGALPLVSPRWLLGANGGLQEAPDKCLSLYTCEEWPLGLVLSKWLASFQGPQSHAESASDSLAVSLSGPKGIGSER